MTFAGFFGEPDDMLNSKKVVWETAQANLHTNAEFVSCYKDVPSTTSAGVFKVSSISGGAMR